MLVAGTESWSIVEKHSLLPSYVIMAVSIVALILLITARLGKQADRTAEFQQ
jgi:hypothetical protein